LHLLHQFSDLDLEEMQLLGLARVLKARYISGTVATMLKVPLTTTKTSIACTVQL
jgi:hypothetical protein